MCVCVCVCVCGASPMMMFLIGSFRIAVTLPQLAREKKKKTIEEGKGGWGGKIIMVQNQFN